VNESSRVARLSYFAVSRAPSGTVSRARVAGRLGPVLERVFAVAGAPLNGAVVPVASGPGEGLRIVGERRSLVWLSGGVEREVQEILVRHLPPGGVFVDVGASVGFFSLLGARLVGSSGSVVAFEPQTAAVASVRRNAGMNGFENVAVVEAAVGATEGELFLRGAGTATAYVTHTPGPDGERVRVTSLDAYFVSRSELEPSVVKIDVEGHELEVLAGMRSLLVGARPVVVIECHGAPVPLVQALEAADYAVSVLGSEVTPRDAGVAHLLATPSASP
jgi:FkbM family methyltransferase